MNKTILLLLVVSMCWCADPAVDKKDGVEKPMVKMATINVEQVLQEIGYENLSMIYVDKETKEILAKLAKEMKDINKEILVTDDEVKGRLLRDKYTALEQKSQWIRSKIQQQSQRGSSREYNKVIIEFVKKEFAKDYPLILNAQGQGFSGERYGVLYINSSNTDITDAVISRFRERYQIDNPAKGAEGF